MIGMLLFMLLPLAGMGYVAWHVWCLLPCFWAWKLLAVLLMVGSFLLMIAGLRGLNDRLPLGLATWSYEVSTSALFVMLYLMMVFLVLDAARLLPFLHARTLLYHNGWTALAITVLMTVVFVGGNVHYRHKVRQPITLHTAKVSRPVRLVLMSDLHLGYHNRRAEVARWVDLVNAERPDLVLIAGDIIDGSMRPLRDERLDEVLRRLDAPIYACLGNHEYFTGEPDARRFYRDAGIRLLQDSTETVGDLTIVGRDDRSNPHRRSLGALMGTVDRRRFTLLLDHQPYHLEQAERQGVDFQFSGHTHHGQVWPISWITDAVYECAFGPHQRGQTRYYVSSGMGIWGGKFRIGTRSEYVVLDLLPE